MNAFRILLVGSFAMIFIYTMMVFSNADLGLVDQALTDLKAKNWAGQFDLDFLIYIFFVALWLLWRHDFKPVGWLMVLGSFGGSLFMAPYLLIASIKADGDVKEVLLGKRRAHA
jgi:hypothetical protein